jgi:hypothetical protein
MISLINQHIKCIFRNGTVVEGMVEEWVPGAHYLRSLLDQSLMIILRPEDDIMMIKIMPDPSEEIVEDKLKNNSSPDQIQEQIRAKLKTVEDPNVDPELQALSITELRNLAIKQERQILVNKVREHFPSGSVKKSNYIPQTNIILRKKDNG